MKHAEVIEFLQRNKERVDEYLLNNLPSDHERPEIKQLYEIMRSHPVQGGKGLRSAFCMLICEAFGGNPDDALNTVACLDLLENWLIIHDDIEDGSDLRRGKPCLYHQYGIPIAINIGDALHCQMWKLLQQNTATLGFELTLRILSEFTRASDETVAGQHIELSWKVVRATCSVYHPRKYATRNTFFPSFYLTSQINWREISL